MESAQPATLNAKNRDKWEHALDRQLIELQQCQQKHRLRSCLHCPELLECTIRDTYVNAVYESMNKGHGGGFEF